MSSDAPRRALLVDLNNFARYPTLAIGYLVAALRSAGWQVEVLCPLNHDVPPSVRERPEGRRAHIERRVYHSTHPAVTPVHDVMRAAWSTWNQRPHRQVLEQTIDALDARRPDVLLLSAYLDHYPLVKAIGRAARARSVPLVLGGPVFNNEDIAREWLSVPGLAALVGGEADLSLPAILDTILDGDDATVHAGVMLPDGRIGSGAPPLQDLGRLPVPDFSDFPWHKYPQRVIPVMTGRGCGWGRCLFCGDVVSANGRTYRSRPVEAVLDEMVEQSERVGTRDFIFLDIKLNSHLPMWRALIEQFQDRLPGGRWIGTVHVQASGDNGLSSDELHAARASGLTRVSFGLETGSQRLNNSMAKGTKLERTSQFLHDANEAGLSVRSTMMLGYPGETTTDIRLTIAFLEEHGQLLDRVAIGRFKAIPGTGFDAQYRRHPERYRDMTQIKWQYRYGRGHYRYRPAGERAYRAAKTELLDLVHRINRRPLREGASAFDGLM